MKDHKPLSNPTDFLIMAGLFMAALLPRVLTLGKFVTADEPYWVVRSLAFATGLLTYDWKLTLQTGHPGVTTMWSGTVGLFLDYLLNHQQAGSFLDFIRALPSDLEKIDAAVLPWMILPIAMLTSSTVVVIFAALRPLDRTVALIAALLWAFEPLYISHSRVLHHDAPVTVFACFAILSFLTALQRHSWKLSLIVGLATGLAFLSKSTGYALLPFMGLTALVELISHRISLGRLVLGGAAWGVALIVTIFIFWPALWVVPVEVFYTVFSWSTESANIDEVSHTLLPNFSGSNMPHLGLLFYPTNWLLKTTPLILLGLLFLPAWWRQEGNASPARWWAARLLFWAGLFSFMLIIGEKKDGRYLLPIYFALSILAAFGLKKLYQALSSGLSKIILSEQMRKRSIQTGFAALLLVVSLPYHPYYLAYYNPLLGGFLFAPYLVKVGWGDGMEQAAAWLNAQPEAASLKVASDFRQTLSPFFAGQVTNLTASQPFSADYVLIYRRQIQNSSPYLEFWDYYQAREPVYQLNIAGIDYLWLYKGPPLVTINRLAFNDTLTLRAFQVSHPMAIPAEPLDVTLIWRAQAPQTEEVYLQLRDEAGKVWVESQPAPVIAPNTPSAVEGYYRLILPAEIPRGFYQLWASLGQNNQWRHFTSLAVGQQQPRTPVTNPFEANFDNRIMLRGFDIDKTALGEGDSFTLTLHWQALNPAIYSYTTFVHLVNPAGETIVQRDLIPGEGQWPTDTWYPGEWITDQIDLALPEGAPPGNYSLLVGWYYWQTGERLPVLSDNGSQDTVLLKEIQIHGKQSYSWQK